MPRLLVRRPLHDPPRRRPDRPAPPSLPRVRPGRPPRGPRRPGTAALIAANLALAAVLADPGAAQVRIQEVLYDGSGADADDAFTELLGPPGTSLAGWSLVGVNGDTGTPYRTVDLTGATIPADSILVVATDTAADSVAAVRDHVGSVDWQNGPDAVRLVDPQGTVVDALQYGDAGAHNAGEGSPAPQVAAGQSLSRDDAGTDTDDNLSDFTAPDTPTPGLRGAPPAGDPPADDPPDTTAALTVSLPDTTAAGGDTLTVPVRFTDTGGLGLLAAEVFLTFDRDLLTLVDVSRADLVDALDWQLAANVLDGGPSAVDTLRIALATDADTLAGSGALVLARFLVADLRRPATSGLTFVHVALNDGGPQAEVAHGAVGLVGVDATLDVSPVPVRMHHPLTIAVADADEDRDPGAADAVAVHLGEGPEAGPPVQHDTLTVVETGPSTGLFVGAVATAYAAPVSANGILEIAPRRRVSICYVDSLDAVGATAERCTTFIVPAHDGQLAATVVAQPGDTLWLRLIDADLDRRPGAVDSAHISAGAHPVTLAEIGVSDSVFFGFVELAPADTGAADSLRAVAYLDTTPTAGDSAVVADTTHVLPRFGDADANGQIQAFDAAGTLGHVLAPHLSGRDSLAANVDSLAPFGAITPYDASLILQHRVGLRHRFPVQASDAANHPRPGLGAHPPSSPLRPAAAPRRHLALRPAAGHLSLWVEDRADILAADLLLGGDDLQDLAVEPDPDLSGFLVAARARPAGPHAEATLRVVLAGAVPVSGPGDLIRLVPSDGAAAPAAVRLLRASLNDERIAVRLDEALSGMVALPTTLGLHPIHPNPFNAAAVIPFDLPDDAEVRLAIYDVLGRQVRDLLAASLTAGRRQATWDGRDDAGRPAATGVYLARLRVGPSSRVRRMLLLR